MDLAEMVRSGLLLPVQVFGGPETCQKCGHDVPWTYGLCDRFTEHSPGGSDCNRAEPFLLRPSDAAMDDPELRAAIDHVIGVGEEPYERLHATPPTR